MLFLVGGMTTLLKEKILDTLVKKLVIKGIHNSYTGCFFTKSYVDLASSKNPLYNVVKLTNKKIHTYPCNESFLVGRMTIPPKEKI